MDIPVVVGLEPVVRSQRDGNVAEGRKRLRRSGKGERFHVVGVVAPAGVALRLEGEGLRYRRGAANEEVAVPGGALHVQVDGVRVGAAGDCCIGGGIAIVLGHGSVHVGLDAQVAEVRCLCISAGGLITAAHLILGLFGIGKAGVYLAAGCGPIHVDSQTGREERGRIIANPGALDGDPPIDIAGVRLLLELELQGDFKLLAVEDAGAVDEGTGEDGVAVLDPALVLGVVAAFVVALLFVASVGVEGEEMGLVVAVQALVNGPAAFERLGHACAVVLQPSLKDGVVGAIAAGRDVDGRIPDV